MPLYEYQCDTCGQRFERIQKFSDPPVAACPACGAPVRKLISSPAIQFKGSGFYITDYAKTGQSGKDSGAEAARTEPDKKDATASAKPAADKPATAAGTASSESKTATTDAPAKTPATTGPK
jgi:putative FmdB family regulatory protein